MGTLLDKYKASLTGKSTTPVKKTTAKTGSLLAEYKKKLLEKSTPIVQPKQTVKVGQLTQQPKVSVAPTSSLSKISVAQPTIQPKVSVALTAEQKQAQALKNIAQSPTAKPQDIIGLGLGPISQKKTEDIKQLIHQQTISQGQKPKETDIKKTIKEVEDARLNYLRKKQKTEVFKKEGVSGQETGPTDKNAIKEFSDALVRSYYSMIKPSIGTLAETAAISPKMKKWGQEFSDKAEAQLLKNPQLLPSQSKNWSNQVANILGEMIPFMATVVGASFVGGPIAGLSTGAMLEKSSAYRNYINQGIPPDKADVISSAYGLVASGIENVFGIRPAIIGGKVMSATTKKIFVKSFLDYAKKELPKIGIKTLKTAIEEGGEEVIQGIAEQIGLKYFDENANIFEGMAENFIGGAVGGAFLGGGGALLKSGLNTQIDKPEPKLPPIREKITSQTPKTPQIKPKTAITEAITPEVGKVATTEPKAPETALIEEARKYKSAEEFADWGVIMKKDPVVNGKNIGKDFKELEPLVSYRKTSDFLKYGEYKFNEGVLKGRIGAGQELIQGKVNHWKERISKGERPIVIIEDKPYVSKITDNLQGGRQYDAILEARVRQGHSRLEAYRQLGIKEVPVVYKSQLTDIWNKANKTNADDALINEAKKYKSAEEFVKAQTNVFHGTPEKGFKLEKGKPLFLTENFDEANTYAGYSYNTKPTGEVVEFYAKKGKSLDLNKTENVKKVFQDIYGSPKLKKAYDSIPETYRYADYSGDIRTLNPKSSPSDFEDWMMMEYQSKPKIENGLKIRTGSYSFEKETQTIRKQLQEAFNTYGKPTRQSVYNNWDSLIKYAKDNGYDYIKHTTESPDASILFPETIALNPEKSLLTKSQLIDIWNKANKLSAKTATNLIEEAKTIKEISQGLEKQKEVAELSKLKQRKSQLEKEIVSTPQKRKTALEKPVKYGTGKIRESKTFKRLTQELKDSGIEEYKAIELAENRVRAIEFVKDNPELSERIAKGLETPPEGITLATLTDEVFKKLNNEGRGKEAIKLAKKQANRAIRSGQEIVSLKEIYNQNSTQRYVNELLKERARKKLNIKYEEGKPTANKVIRTRAEAINRQINKKASKIKSAQEIINSIIC